MIDNCSGTVKISKVLTDLNETNPHISDDSKIILSIEKSNLILSDRNCIGNQFNDFYEFVAEDQHFKEMDTSEIITNFFNNLIFQEVIKKKFINLTNLIKSLTTKNEDRIRFNLYLSNVFVEKIDNYMENFFNLHNNLDFSKEFEKFFYDQIKFFRNENNEQSEKRDYIINDINKIEKWFAENISAEYKYENFKLFILTNIETIDMTLSNHELYFLRNKLLKIVNSNQLIIKRYYPDINESLYFLTDENFDYCKFSTNIDLYDYLFILNIFENYITSDNIEYKRALEIPAYRNTKNNRYKFFDHVLKIRYFFLRNIFPFMSKKIFINYVDFFLFNYERICALDNIFSIRIRRKLVFVSLFLFKILSDLHFYTQNEKLPDKLFLFYCLSSCKDHKDNSRDRFMQYFDSTYIFGTVNYFMSKYLPENNDKHIKWKTIINEKNLK